MSKTLTRFLASITTTALSFSLSAQCHTSLLVDGAVTGTSDEVQYSTRWDPDGAGPLPPVIVVAGRFAVAGNVLADGLALYDETTDQWSPLVSPLTRPSACTTLANGDLAVAGRYSDGNGTVDHRVMRYDGSTWYTVGDPLDTFSGTIETIHERPNGDLVIGGGFTFWVDNPNPYIHAIYVAQLVGTTWESMRSGLQGGSSWGRSGVYAFHELPNGKLLAAGNFSYAPFGTNIPYLAEWDGTVWQPFAGGAPDHPVFGLLALTNGEFVINGRFVTVGGALARGVARWDGTNWQPYGSGILAPQWIDGGVHCLLELPNGELIAGGDFSFNGTNPDPASSVARWDGSTWEGVGPGLANIVNTLELLPNGHIFAGGRFVSTGSGAYRNHASIWDGSAWQSLGGAPLGHIYAIAIRPNGLPVIAGRHSVSEWNGSQWVSLAPSVFGSVSAVAILTNGDVVVGGWFAEIGGIAAANLARWDGSTWHAMGTGADDLVLDLLVLPSGDLVAAGDFQVVDSVAAKRIARWDGTSWHAYGPGFEASVAAVAHHDGDLIAGGSFTASGGTPINRVARWSGAAWQAIGVGTDDSVSGITTRANGDLVVCGRFDMAGGITANGVAAWNGQAWIAFGSGLAAGFDFVDDVVSLPNGDLVACGQFDEIPAGTTVNALARWSNGSWQAIGSGLEDEYSAGYALALATLPNGDVAIGGVFVFADDQIADNFATLTTDCPASVATVAGGCASSGGSNTLAASSLPWTGATFASQATGLPATAFVASVYGFATTSLPLQTVLPQALPGCDLLVTVDVLDLLIADQGEAQSQIALANSAALAGQVFHHQMVPLEVAVGLGIVEVTSTNALTLTVGTF